MAKTPWGDIVSRGRSMKPGGDNRESGMPAGGRKPTRRTFEMKPEMNKGIAPIGPNKSGTETRLKALKKKMASM